MIPSLVQVGFVEVVNTDFVKEHHLTAQLRNHQKGQLKEHLSLFTRVAELGQHDFKKWTRKIG
jgi:hypothetical protein